MIDKEINRRDFFKMAGMALLATATLPLLKIGNAFAQSWEGFKSPPPADKKIVDPAVGPGKTNKYAYHAKDYKGNKTPAITATSNCANCLRYMKSPTTPANWAPCQMLGMGYVYQEGLCGLYAKNPKA